METVNKQKLLESMRKMVSGFMDFEKQDAAKVVESIISVVEQGFYDSPSAQEDFHEDWKRERDRADANSDTIDRLREANKLLTEERDKWIKQYHRLEDLAAEVQDISGKAESRAIQAEKERDIAVKALRFYAEESNHSNVADYPSSDVYSDSGSAARTALEEIKKLKP